MLIIPELETVFILVPRTGSGAIRRAVAAAYPASLQIYRHMEADGVPAGYDRWRRIGVVRHPVDRLWSLYKYLQTFGEGKIFNPVTGAWPPSYVAEQRGSVVGLGFSDWIVRNRAIFTHPYITGDTGFRPFFTLRHPLPENLKSQFVYLRPDLGTGIYRYEELGALATELGINLARHHHTDARPAPTISAEAMEHMRLYFGWDFTAVERSVAA